MHLVMILVALGVACLLRCYPFEPWGNWTQRWQRALFLFLFPPLLLLMTALAVLCMGPQGQMMGWRTDWYSYCLVLGGVVVAIAFCGKLGFEGWLSLRQARAYSQIDLDGNPARLLDNPLLFSAQIGFWQPELVVSRGLLQKLSPEHIKAVIRHEQAHVHYRDTFWFFWLGCLRRISRWLPNTEALWQELLVLRELRADCWAAQGVDALLLAESLLVMVSAPATVSEELCAAFSCAAPRERLQERIDALLGEPELPTRLGSWRWSWVLLALLPLIAVPFHS